MIDAVAGRLPLDDRSMSSEGTRQLPLDAPEQVSNLPTRLSQ